METKDNSFTAMNWGRLNLAGKADVARLPKAEIRFIVMPARILRVTYLVCIGVFFLMLIPLSIYSQQASNTSNRKPHVIRQDTSEEALVKQFRNMMDNSETVMDAQVISMESKWGLDKDAMFFKGRREIYTVITFKVFHWIKGSLRGHEITFYVWGGKIDDTAMEVSPSPRFRLKERAILSKCRML